MTLWLKGVEEGYILTGSVLGLKGQRPVPVVTRFQARVLFFVFFSTVCVCVQAQILIAGLPESRPLMTSGYQCVMHLHTSTVPITIDKIVSVLDKKTGKPKKGQAFARKGAAVVINASVTHPIALEKYEDFNPLSRLLLRDETLTVAVGKIMKLGVEKKK